MNFNRICHSADWSLSDLAFRRLSDTGRGPVLENLRSNTSRAWGKFSRNGSGPQSKTRPGCPVRHTSRHPRLQPSTRVALTALAWLVLPGPWLGAAAASTTCQGIIPPQGDWAFGTSEDSRHYLRAERFQADGPVTGFRVQLVQMEHDPDLWNPCSELVLMMHVLIAEDQNDHPGPILEELYQVVHLVPVGLVYGGTAQLLEAEIEVEASHGFTTGWLALSGRGLPDCLALWGSSSGGDGYSCLDRGAGWEFVDYDLNLCALWQPLVAPQASIAAESDGIHVRWETVLGATGYQIYQALGDEPFSPLGPVRTQLEWVNTSPVTDGHVRYQVRAIGN